MTEKLNKFQERRRNQQLDGICDLLVEYNFTIDDVNVHLRERYTPKDVRATEARLRHRTKVKQVERARHANASRWQKQRDFLAAPTPKERAAERVAAADIPVPNLSTINDGDD